ncbi:pyrroline-5-carboxylate reductase isoform X1 [Anoplophora glabripennis]|uniref:pyrroline-5-carboxylate reductase isoform X1 n=2 Tax=Anoplophora glabripennis TaxID=217634 RepID=UPI0008748FB6|nr:pyrroline-5-carboxylate reductase isoform X1 [Anoplophora glabripennis]
MASKLLKIGFIGGGKMAQAMAKGFISAGLTKGDKLIASCHPSDMVSANAFKEIGAEAVFENVPIVQNSDIVIISVKPSVVSVALSEIKSSNLEADKLFLSIVMGVSTKALEQLLPSSSRVIRIMPNTPALVRNAASVFVTGRKATEADVRITKRLLESVGTCEQVPEGLLDPITALSGSGPAYIYVLIEALADGGVKMGLPRDLAYRLASQTVLGAAQMVRDTKAHPGVLKDDVTSPAGSTAAGLHFLEQQGFRAAVIGAIESATQRCREVSKNAETK